MGPLVFLHLGGRRGDLYRFSSYNNRSSLSIVSIGLERDYLGLILTKRVDNIRGEVSPRHSTL
jgi:hypothetical protein